MEEIIPEIIYVYETQAELQRLFDRFDIINVVDDGLGGIIEVVSKNGIINTLTEDDFDEISPFLRRNYSISKEAKQGRGLEKTKKKQVYETKTGRTYILVIKKGKESRKYIDKPKS